MAIEFSHKTLAETHNLIVALAVRIEVRTALTAAHREACKGILEYLLECEELERGEGDFGVEPDTAFVRPYG